MIKRLSLSLLVLTICVSIALGQPINITSLTASPNNQIIRNPANIIIISWNQDTENTILISQLNITKPDGINDTYSISTSQGSQSLIYNQTNYSLTGLYTASVYVEDNLGNSSINTTTFNMNLFSKSLTLNNTHIIDVVSVINGSPDSNLVSDTYIYEGWYYMTGGKYWSFFKYNLSSGPTIYNLINATLRLFSAEMGVLSVHEYVRIYEVNNDSWNQSIITWNNKPTEINHTYESQVDLYKIYLYGTYQTWNITNMLNNSNNGDKLLSIMMNTSSFYNTQTFLKQFRNSTNVNYQHLITAYHSDNYNTIPSVYSLSSSLGNNFKANQTTTLSYTQSDNFQIDYSELNITKPDSINDTHELSNTSGSVNYAFANTSIGGIYNTTAFVRDTAGATNITGLTFYVYEVPTVSNELLVNYSMSNEEINFLNYTCTDWGNPPSTCWVKITREDGTTINSTGQVDGINCSVPITAFNIGQLTQAQCASICNAMNTYDSLTCYERELALWYNTTKWHSGKCSNFGNCLFATGINDTCYMTSSDNNFMNEVNQTGDFYIQGFCNDTVNQLGVGVIHHGSRVDPSWSESVNPMTIFEGQTKNLTYFSYLTLNNTLSTTYWNRTATYNFTKIANITTRDSVTYSFTNETEGVLPSYVSIDYYGDTYENIGHVNITSIEGHYNTLELFDNNSNSNSYFALELDFNNAIGGASSYPVMIENGTINLEFNINDSNGLMLLSLEGPAFCSIVFACGNIPYFNLTNNCISVNTTDLITFSIYDLGNMTFSEWNNLTVIWDNDTSYYYAKLNNNSLTKIETLFSPLIKDINYVDSIILYSDGGPLTPYGSNNNYIWIDNINITSTQPIMYKDLLDNLTDSDTTTFKSGVDLLKKQIFISEWNYTDGVVMSNNSEVQHTGNYNLSYQEINVTEIINCYANKNCNQLTYNIANIDGGTVLSGDLSNTINITALGSDNISIIWYGDWLNNSAVTTQQKCYVGQIVNWIGNITVTNLLNLSWTDINTTFNLKPSDGTWYAGNSSSRLGNISPLETTSLIFEYYTPAIITIEGYVEQGEARINENTTWMTNVQWNNTANEGYYNITGNLSIPNLAIPESIILRDENETNITVYFNNSEGYIEWNRSYLGPNGIAYYNINYSTIAPNITTSDQSNLTHYILYLNLTGPSGVSLTNVWVNTSIYESILSPVLYKKINGNWTDISLTYNVLTEDNNANGKSDELIFTEPLLINNNEYKIIGEIGEPITVSCLTTDNQWLSCDPSTLESCPKKYTKSRLGTNEAIYWEMQCRWYNPNNVTKTFTKKIRLTSDATNIFINTEPKQLLWDGFGPYISIVDNIIRPRTYNYYNITYYTPPVFSELTYFYPINYKVDEDGLVNITIRLSNYGNQNITQTIQKEITIDYGEEIKLIDANNNTIENYGTKQGTFTLNFNGLNAGQTVNYTLSYLMPTAISHKVRPDYITRFNNTEYKVSEYDVCSIAYIPLPELRWYYPIDKEVSCLDINYVLKVDSFIENPTINNQLNTVCTTYNSRKTLLIDLDSLDVGGCLKLKFYKKTQPALPPPAPEPPTWITNLFNCFIALIKWFLNLFKIKFMPPTTNITI